MKGQYVNKCHYFESILLPENNGEKNPKEKLELVPDPDIYIFFEKGTRSGVSFISNGYTKTNSKYLESYDQKQESKDMI